MSYLKTLDDEQTKNLSIMVDALAKSPITNILSRAAVLSVDSKECEFFMHKEKGYGGTSNARIREIFGHHFDNMSEEELTALKHNDEAFFNSVYGGLYGNGPTDGYKYRSRGFNSETFEGNYKVCQDLINAHRPEGQKIDLVGNPDLLNDPHIAAEATIAYFMYKFSKITLQAISDIHAHGINDFTNIDDALLGIYRANAGWNKPVFPDNTGGYAKAKARVGEFLELLKK